MLSLSGQNLTMQGKAMTGNLRAMHAESVAAFAKMQALSYNSLELSQQAFVADYAAYQIAMNSIERRLAGILRMVCFWAAFCSPLQFCPYSLSQSIFCGQADQASELLSSEPNFIGLHTACSAVWSPECEAGGLEVTQEGCVTFKWCRPLTRAHHFWVLLRLWRAFRGCWTVQLWQLWCASVAPC